MPEVRTGVVASNGIPLACFFWPADVGACGQYRCYMPAKALAQQFDIQVEVAGHSTLPFTILVAQRTHKPDPVNFLKFIREQRTNTGGVPKIVYEIDDDLWSIEPHNKKPYEYFNQEGNLARAEEAIALADLVTVSTQPLADIVSKWNDNVVVLPNSVPDRLFHEGAYPYTTGEPGKPYVLGWAGSNTHLEDLNTIMSTLDSFLRLTPNSRMVFFGTDYTHLLSPSVHAQCRYAPWQSTVVGFHDLLGRAQIDVMLAPITPTKFNESKSNLRLIEAAALGIPTIATDFGPYSSASHGKSALLVQPGDSWMSALNELNNPLLRLEMSRHAREWAAEYRLSITAAGWRDAYLQLLED